MGVNRPDITQVAPGVYVLRFEDAGVSVKAERLRAGRETTAELSFSTDIDGHVKREKLNLLSGQMHSRLAKALTERVDGRDWYAIIENTTLALTDIARMGEPVVPLIDVAPQTTTRWAVNPLVVSGDANVIYGPGDSGKSLLGILIAILVSTGQETDLGMEVVEPGNVLYMDWETNNVEIASRTSLITAGMGMSMPANLYYRYMSAPLADDVEAVQNIIAEYGVSLVVIDSMGPAIAGDTSRDEPINEFFNALRGLRVTTLIIDHINKEGGQYGSIYKYNRARNVWRVRPSEESRVDGIARMGLYHEKFNNGRRVAAPLGISFAFDTESGMIMPQRTAAMDDPELGQFVGTRLRIRQAMRAQGPQFVAALAEELGIKENTTLRALQRNAEFEQIPPPDRRWHLRGETDTVPSVNGTQHADPF